MIAFVRDGPIEFYAMFVAALYGAYAFIRAYIARPSASSYIPLFSKDPQLMTLEGIKWRRRFYVACFILVAWVFGRLVWNQIVRGQ